MNWLGVVGVSISVDVSDVANGSGSRLSFVSEKVLSLHTENWLLLCMSFRISWEAFSKDEARALFAANSSSVNTFLFLST